MGTVQRSMMQRGGDPGFPSIQEPRMVGHLLVLEEDLDPLHKLMDLDLFAQQSFRHRVAVGVDLHVARHIHGSIEGLIDRGDVGRQGA